MKKKFSLWLLTVLFSSVITFAQPSKNLTLLDSITFTGQTLAGCWHYNDSLGHEYAIVGASAGIIIVDITDPTNAQELFQLPGANSLWHEVKVQGQYAYAVSEGTDAGGLNNGVQIIDLRYLPDSVPYKFYYGDGQIDNQIITAHSITTAGHYVYVNGHNISTLGNGVLILDIADPWNPQFVGAVTNRYCHDSYVRGDTIYTSDIRDGLFSVYDITNRANPVILATQATPGTFNHNTWLSDDGHVIFTTDEHTNDPVGAYDISDLSNITLLDTFFNANFPNKEVHNVRVLNDYVIAPSYGSQLTIIDAARPANMIEVGNFTTGSSLCWDADPYLNSGNIIATDMSSGTFYVFGPTYQRACYLEGLVTDSVSGLPIFNDTVTIQSVGITKSTAADGNYKMGYADSGTYVVSYIKSGYYTQQHSVNLQNGVLTIKDVKLVPEGTGISELAEKNVTVFPNPVTNELNVDLAGLNLQSWKLRDALGKTVLENLSKGKSSGIVNIDVHSLSAGCYSLELQVDDGKIIRQIVKK